MEGPHGQAPVEPRGKGRRARKTKRREVVAATGQVGAAPASEAAPRWRSLVLALLLAGVAAVRERGTGSVGGSGPGRG